MKTRRVLRAGASLPVGVPHAPSTWMCAPTWKLSEPHVIGIFLGRLYYVGVINH